MIFAAPEVSKITNALAWWERGEYLFSFVVAAACFGEYVADFKPRWYRTGDSKRDEKRKESISKQSTLILVAALVFELLCVVRSNTLAGAVIGSINDLAMNAAGQATTALDKAKQANNLAQGASEAAGPAKSTAHEAKIEADAAGLKADTVFQEAKQIDSSLSFVMWVVSARRVQDESGLVSDMRTEFSGTRIAFTSYAGDEEGFWLCDQLVRIAEKAGVIPEDECADEQLPSIPVVDLLIKAPNRTEAMRLIEVLKKQGRVPGLGVTSNEAPHLTVLVGVKRSLPLIPPKTLGASTPLIKRPAKH